MTEKHDKKLDKDTVVLPEVDDTQTEATDIEESGSTVPERPTDLEFSYNGKTLKGSWEPPKMGGKVKHYWIDVIGDNLDAFYVTGTSLSIELPEGSAPLAVHMRSVNSVGQPELGTHTINDPSDEP